MTDSNTRFSFERTGRNQYQINWMISIPRAFVWDPNPSETPFGVPDVISKSGWQHFTAVEQLFCLSYAFKSFASGHHSEDGLGLHVTLKRKCQDADHLLETADGPPLLVSSLSEKPQRVMTYLSRKLVIMSETSKDSDVWNGCFKVRYLGTVEHHKLQPIKIVIEFGPPSLKSCCESVLSEELDATNVISLFEFADWLLYSNGLKYNCLDFMAKNKSMPLKRDSFIRILRESKLSEWLFKELDRKSVV